MKKLHIFCFVAVLTSMNAYGTTLNFNLAGLHSPTGAATNDGNTRQYAFTTTGGELTITYTLSISMSSTPVDIDLANPFQEDWLFRRPGLNGQDPAQLPPSGTNIMAGESFTITMDLITANAGWTLDSLTRSDTVGIAGDGRNGSEIATFTINGGTAFNISELGTSGIVTKTDTRFTAFDSAGDTLTYLADAGNSGKLNLLNLAFSAEVSAIPEPSSALLLGFVGGLALLRRRR